ncbi:MAG: hypothetical protein KAF91_31395 [Nostoc sp. TH1S01]|nr:hypothetical protein [Nostoc sp. TH1S01]
MTSIGQIRGMLLEEALLYLLRLSGYRTVEKADGDSTLNEGHSGLEVFGRGSKHQIDAIADFVIAQPFSNPQRLLLEAKFRSETTGIDVIRNAVGVLKDVSEYWVSKDKIPPKARYHYQYAVFSASDYTSPAQKYAYAHDIYLIPLSRSTFFQPVLQAIASVTIDDFPENINRYFLKMLRISIRQNLQNIDRKFTVTALYLQEKIVSKIDDFCYQCHRLNGALLAMLNKQFPIFLVPNLQVVDIRQLDNFYKVRIYWNREGWYIRQSNSDADMFSFDLPKELFNLYAQHGFLSKINALDLKSQYMSEIQAILTLDGYTRIITFKLDTNWLNNLRKTLNNIEEEE